MQQNQVKKGTKEMEFFTEYGDANRYRILEVIGKGSYGVVCAAIDTHTGEKVAIKKINDVFEHISDALRILREVKLLRVLRHSDIVEIKSIMMPPSKREFKDIYVVFELMELDLHQVIKANDDLTREHHQFFLYRMLRALKFMHTANVYHRDLKPNNILANANCKLKVCDFGLARVAFNDTPTTVFWTDYVVTRWYRAPELCGSFFSKSSGVQGFVSGFGKGIIGAAAQPVSGVLDLLSKTTEGANAMRMKIAAAITSDEQLLRRRLPRAIGADSLLRPYNEYRAQGQVILQLAESGSFLDQVDLFKVRGKFALTDAYESHFILPKGKVLMITHRRVILLQQPSNIIGQRKFIPAKDACSIQWDVLWNDLVTMELTDGKKDQPNSPPSRLILYLKSKPNDSKEQVRVVKCSPNTKQAFEVYSAIDQSINLYGQNAEKGMVKNKVTRPYSPISESSWAEGASQHMPASVTPSSTFGTSPTTSSS